MTNLPVAPLPAGTRVTWSGDEWYIKPWGWDRLTQRERQITLGLAGQHAIREIADQLGITQLTVRNHLRSVYDKLNVTGTFQLVILMHGGAVPPEARRYRLAEESP